jgi:hypothetical protein
MKPSGIGRSRPEGLRSVAPSNPTCSMKFSNTSAVSDSYRHVSSLICTAFIESAIGSFFGSVPDVCRNEPPFWGCILQNTAGESDGGERISPSKLAEFRGQITIGRASSRLSSGRKWTFLSADSRARPTSIFASPVGSDTDRRRCEPWFFQVAYRLDQVNEVFLGPRRSSHRYILVAVCPARGWMLQDLARAHRSAPLGC